MFVKKEKKKVQSFTAVNNDWGKSLLKPNKVLLSFLFSILLRGISISFFFGGEAYFSLEKAVISLPL